MPTRKIDKLSKREIRYWLFRFQNANNGGSPAKGAPPGLKKHFEEYGFFTHLGGWSGFAKLWDVNPDAPLEVVPRDKSVIEEWNEVLVANAKELPRKKKRKVVQVDLDPARNDHGEINITLKRD